MLVRVFPHREAQGDFLAGLAQRKPHGFLEEPPSFTLDNLLPTLIEEAPPIGQPLAPLAGPLLVGRCLEELGPRAGQYHGLGRGWRLPRQLWRLLTEIKAAGLDAASLAELARAPGASDSQRLAGLAELLAAYQRALDQAGLRDVADGLRDLEDWLARGGRPRLTREWSQVRVGPVVWLRTLDLRLLRALALCLPPRGKVEVAFAMLPLDGARPELTRLLEATARCLEDGLEDRIEVTWPDPQDWGGPLSGLAQSILTGQTAPGSHAGAPLEAWVLPGPYAQCQFLVQKARDLVVRGVPAHRVAIAFPDLAVAGQQTADAARRAGLPLQAADREPLSESPLAQAFWDLISLPLRDYGRVELGRVLASPYVRPALEHRLGQAPPARPEALLAEAGYVDARETPTGAWLTQAAERSRRRDGLLGQAGAVEGLRAWLDGRLRGASDLTSLSQGLGDLLADLDLKALVLRDGGSLGARLPGAPPPAQQFSRDLAAIRGLETAVEEMALAAAQAGGAVGGNWSLGRGLAVFQEIMAATPHAVGGAARGGVRLLPLDQLHGLDLDHVLIGGMEQGSFPMRPSGQNLLSHGERLRLGKHAIFRPVWRTEEEEAGGQILRLACVLGQVGRGATLAMCAADSQGREREPSLWFHLAAGLADAEIQRETGGVFGPAADLTACRDLVELWAQVAHARLLPGAGAPVRDRARGALEVLLSQGRGQGLWDDLSRAAAMETQRADQDRLPLAQRSDAAGEYCGRLRSPQALDALARLLAQPARRALSPSQLESFASCPLAWFMGYMLGLTEPDEPGWDLEGRQEGQWVHETLKVLLAQPGPPPDRERLAQSLAACRPTGGAHPAVLDSRQRRLAAGLWPVVRAEAEALRGWEVVAAEEPLCQGRGLVMVVDQGPPLVLTGRLDRLDRAGARWRVVDYKHGRDKDGLRAAVAPEAQAVGAFQLLVYMAAVAACAPEPAASLEARLVSTRLPRLNLPVLELAPDDPLLCAEPARRRELARQGQPNLYNGVEDIWRRMSGGDFVAQPAKDACRYCPYQTICRARRGPEEG